jgi:16S rRNA (cytosine967-C5)-methyltransferase
VHPAQLLDEAAQLIALLLRFEQPADTVVSHYFRAHKSLGPRERATLAEAAYSVLRFKPRYEYFAQQYQGHLTRRLALLGLSQATNLPLELTTDASERAWLAQCKAQDIERLPVPLQHCLPTWLANALHDQYGNAMKPLALSLLQAAPLDLRVNLLKAKRDDGDGALSKLKVANINCSPTKYSPWGIRLNDKPSVQKWETYEQGEVEVQDEGSQLLAHLTGAKRGEMVADFCAGAGGKTLALGAMMRNTGRLYAFDISDKRLDKLKPRLARSGLSNVHPVAIEHERDARIKRLAGKMDRVLVDAPCSGLGTLRRHPDLKWRQTPQTIAAFQEKQQSILQAAASLVKPGGRLVYATCSLLKAENSEVAAGFVKGSAEFKSVNMADWAAGLGLDAAVQEFGDLHAISLRPDIHGTDGFFAVVLDRDS